MVKCPVWQIRKCFICNPLFIICQYLYSHPEHYFKRFYANGVKHEFALDKVIVVLWRINPPRALQHGQQPGYRSWTPNTSQRYRGLGDVKAAPGLRMH